MTRTEFIRTAGAAAALTAAGDALAGDVSVAATADFDLLQREIDEVTPQDFAAYLCGEEVPFFNWFGLAGRKAALQRLEDAFDKVLAEIRTTTVTDRPAVWLVYNMGIVVKTREALFSVDLKHRRATELAPMLDFALITHNHGDHFTEEFYQAMNGAGKAVVSNFKDNYGAKPWKERGGYTRATKVFRLKDVEVRTTLTDHNDYLVDFTTAFEIRVGDFVIFHSGDCSNVAKLNPTKRPDLWIVHPYCGMKTEDGVRKMKPALTAIAHLNELGHARDKWRWTYQDGLKAKAAAEKAGGKAILSVWGERLV